ncbi:restriction endonuclease [Mesorhizobium sp. M0715]|uniref:restriction endonuclease n=1 Tax=Mesorhizobium sp. M0715 TaxID=2956990 RepID=UPI003339BE44
MQIDPMHVRYIKLGESGRWAPTSLSQGNVSFGYHSIPHETCEAKDWDSVWHMLSARKSAGAQTAGVNEVRAFYELGSDCLWITFADGHMYWSFSEPEVVWLGDGSDKGPSRIRKTIGSWNRTDVNGRPLRVAELSSKLTKVGNFRATICKVEAEKYLLRRINGIEEPIVARAKGIRKEMLDVASDMIKGLDWAHFETLTDLIFTRSGWQRSTLVGQNIADVDMVIEQPTTRETAFVQVKSQAGQGTLDQYLKLFRRSGYDRFFFVCHSAHGKLSLPAEPNLHLFEGDRLADAAVKNGLFDWLVDRSG